MKFGIYNEIQASPGADHKQRYDDSLRAVELGDRLGYDVFMTLERLDLVVDAELHARASASATRRSTVRYRCRTAASWSDSTMLRMAPELSERCVTSLV